MTVLVDWKLDNTQTQVVLKGYMNEGIELYQMEWRRGQDSNLQARKGDGFQDPNVALT